jgi:hypothetical protein
LEEGARGLHDAALSRQGWPEAEAEIEPIWPSRGEEGSVNLYGKSANRFAERTARCGPPGNFAKVADAYTFIVVKLAVGWTNEDLAWALGMSRQAVGKRIARLRKISLRAA